MKKFTALLLIVIIFVTVAACSGSSVKLGAYFWNPDDPELNGSMIILEDSSRALYIFRVGSYMNYVNYAVDGDTITFTTASGESHYTFKIEDDKFIFDAANSTEQLWGGEYGDGAVFQWYPSSN